MPSADTVFRYFDERGGPTAQPTTSYQAVRVERTGLAAHLAAAGRAADAGRAYRPLEPVAPAPAPAPASGPNLADSYYERGAQLYMASDPVGAEKMFLRAGEEAQKNPGRYSLDLIWHAIQRNDELGHAMRAKGLIPGGLTQVASGDGN